MTVPARHAKRKARAQFDDDSDDDAGDDSGDDAGDDFAAGAFYSGERVCLPPDGAGDSGALRALILILMVVGGGWALLRYPSVWQGWLPAELAAVSPAVEQSAPAPAAAAVAPPAPPALPEPAVQVAAVAPLPPEAQPAAPTASIEKEAAPAAQPLPPPTVDPADPYQKRAAAVGLHPDLSRALLARLSAADYRNAGVAIKTAVAKTPDTAIFVWPRQRTPELALFRVRFVPGAAPHCRRYVVTVTKDRWSTTAPPMETCGANVAAGKNK